MTIALINNKGGVGKTTTAINLAAAWARSGASTLLVDLDAQCSASLHLGVRDGEHDIYSALQEGAVRPQATRVENLQLVPGSLQLSALDMERASDPDRDQLLKRALASVEGRFDRIVLDCPPSLSMVTANALRCSSAYLVPLSPHYLAMEGLAQLMRWVGPDGPRCLGILLTMVDSRLRVTSEIVELLRARFRGQVLDTEVKTNVRLSEASSFGQSIFEYDPHSSGARAYAALKEEVDARCQVSVKAG